MTSILDMTLREALRNVAGYITVGAILWLPVIVELLRAGR